MKGVPLFICNNYVELCTWRVVSRILIFGGGGGGRNCKVQSGGKIAAGGW